jgi:hypothetical protein
MRFNFVCLLDLAMKIHAVLQPYCNLMHDIKVRVDAMQRLEKNRSRLPDHVLFECQQLQIRMISETIAIACLLVHGDIEGAQSKRLSKAYQADFIINALEKLHPRFYPQPTRQILHNGRPVGLEDINEGYLTKADLLKSYRDAATFLHAGSLSEFLANETADSDHEAVRNWVRKLSALLSHHSIFLADEPDAWNGNKPLKFADGEIAPKYQIIVQMQPDGKEWPQAWVFESIRHGELPQSGSQTPT